MPSVVLVGSSDRVEAYPPAPGSANGKPSLVGQDQYRSKFAPWLGRGVIAMIAPGGRNPHWSRTDTEAVVLIRRGITDAVTALATPHALLLGRPGALPRPLRTLTRREQEVLTELALGKVNKEIASTLHVTRQTAQRYVGRVLMKLRVANRTEAARVAVLGDQTHLPTAGR